ncbi:MAG TPA: hypothetical protein VFC06_07635 [Demequina sp.]|nr:hypothetical protein [Demequina sp.]
MTGNGLGGTGWQVPPHELARLRTSTVRASSAASLALLIAFCDTQLLFGIAIDVALIVLAVMRPGWTVWVSG